MKKLIIADITSLNKNGKVFGHFEQVAKMYVEIFKDHFDVKIAGGPIYSNNENIINLKYDNDLNSMGTKIGRLKVKLKEIANGIRLVMDKNDNIIIFQSYSIKSILISLFFLRGNKKIYLIQYKNELKNKVVNFLYKLNSKKINGIICPNEIVGESYNKPFIVVTDYINYDNKKIDKVQVEKKYDFSMVGIMSEGKDVEDIVNTFRNTPYKVAIAGYFGDVNRYNYIINNKSDNIDIINKYLTTQEYKSYINKSKYIILPYKEYYKSATSGVIFDVLFDGVPVITKSYNTFKFVENFDIGYLYDNTLQELNYSEILRDDRYQSICNNIDKFLEKNSLQIDKLIKFIKG